MAQVLGFLAAKDTVLVWDAEGMKQPYLTFLMVRVVFTPESGVTRLRESHRIVGSLIGCLPSFPRQSAHLGLPLQLLPEETTLLVNESTRAESHVCVSSMRPLRTKLCSILPLKAR